MKHFALALSILSASTLSFAAGEGEPAFETVLEIKRPADEQLRLDLAPVVPQAMPPAPASAAPSATPAAAVPAIPMIGSSPGAVVSSPSPSSPTAPGPGAPQPIDRFESMKEAAAKGVDPLELRATTAVVKDERLSDVDERSILQVVTDEWDLFSKMTNSQRLEWVKQNPAVPGGLLALVLLGFAVLVTALKRR